MLQPDRPWWVRCDPGTRIYKHATLRVQHREGLPVQHHDNIISSAGLYVRMSLSAVVCAVVVLIHVAMETAACSCYPKTLSEYYCDSDFALKAWVSNWTSEGTPPAAVSTYTLNIVRAFKVPFGYRNKTELTVHSLDSDAMCGMNPGHNYRSLRKPLNPYKRYFITVNVREDGQLWGELCQNTYRRWRQLSCDEKKEIRHFKNMKCRT